MTIRRLQRSTLLATLIFLITAAFGQASAQRTPIYSLRDRFQPNFAQNGMVASQEAVATKIGVEILKRGGNAIDAAIATGFALAVTLPRAGNLGGGGFMMIHLADTQETKALDYRETAPSAAFRDMFLDGDGKPDNNKSRFSGLAIGVPGTVAGFAEAFQQHGSGNLSWADLVEPAVKLAEEGIIVTPDLAASLRAAAKRLLNDPTTAQIFYKTNGDYYFAGERLIQSDLANSLKAIATNGAKGFYAGRTAEKIIEKVRASGGNMTLDDMKNYRPKWREPVRGTYRGYTIASMPPPSSGGIHLIQILNILENYPNKEYGPNSASSIHIMAEAMRRAYADRSQFLGDPDFVEIPQTGITSKEYARELTASIHLEKATPSSAIKHGNPAPYESNETTHFSVVDKQGNAVTNTYTLNLGLTQIRVSFFLEPPLFQYFSQVCNRSVVEAPFTLFKE